MKTIIQPKEITRCVDTSMNTASFEYYDGIQYTKEHNLEQTTEFSEVRNNNKFIVCCGDVMVKVSETDYPNIIRRDF